MNNMEYFHTGQAVTHKTRQGRATGESIFSVKQLNGFTLVEFCITAAIVAILAMLAVPAYQNFIDDANENKAIADISTISQAVERYRVIHNEALPSNLADLAMDTMTDPWGNPYQYYNIGAAKGNGKLRKDQNLVPINSDFDLYSMGKDGESRPPLTAEPSHDDIVRANDGGYVGIATGY